LRLLPRLHEVASEAADDGLLLLAAPLAVHAQRQSAARVGYLSMRQGPNEFEQAFLRGLRERGWIEGSNLAVDFRWADDSLERLQAMVADLVTTDPALVVSADFGAQSVHQLNPAIPILHPLMADPIAQGLTASLSHPDRNVTGISVFGTELSHKRLELFKCARCRYLPFVFDAPGHEPSYIVVRRLSLED